MNYIQALREKFGLSQMVFADLLGCDRTLLSKAEGGQRNLPDNSRKIFYHMDDAWQQFQTSSAQAPEPSAADDEAVQDFLATSLKQSKAQLTVCELENESLTEKITKAEEQVKFLAALTAFPLPPEAEIGQMQIVILKRKLPKKLAQLYLEQAQLKIKIAVLQAEIDCATSLQKKSL